MLTKLLGIETEEQKQQRIDRQAVDDYLRKVIVFPGTKEEFEEYAGHRCNYIRLDGRLDQGIEVLVNLHPHKEVTYHPFERTSNDLKKELADKGLIAIVGAAPIAYFQFGDDYGRYGMPVARA